MSTENTYGYGYGEPLAERGRGKHIIDYWHIVLEHIVWVIVFLAAAVSLAIFITYQQERLYRSTAVIKILPPSTTAAALMPTLLNDDVYLETELEVLQMAPTLERAIDQANLTEHRDFEGMTRAEILREAKGNVEVNRHRRRYLVDVSIIGPKRKILDDLCNALVDSFREGQRNASKRLRQQRIADLRSQIDGIDTKIRLQRADKEGALRGTPWTEATFFVAFSQMNERLGRYASKLDELTQEQLAIQPVEQRFRDAIGKDAEGWTESLLSDPFVRRDTRIPAYEEELSLLERRLAATSAELGPANPEVQRQEQAIDELKVRRQFTVREIVLGTLQEYEDRKQTIEALEKRRDDIATQLERSTEIKRNVDAKNANIDDFQLERAALNKELETLQALTSNQDDAVTSVARAQEPVDPFQPNKTMNLIVGSVLGLMGGLMLAFLLDYMDDTIRTKDELGKVAPEVPLLGIIPNIEVRRRDLSTKDLYAWLKPKSTIAEAYRGVRTALTLSADAESCRCLLLTSAGPREGKTTTSINTGTVFAYSGARTLIVDADLRKPRLHKSLGVTNEAGLSNCLVDESIDPATLCQQTEIPNVWMLPSGPVPPNPSELLGRKRMKVVLDRLRETFDQIIVDTPPIGAVTDAAILAKVVDGVILVVHAGKTRRTIVHRGLEQLRHIEARIVGVVLNNLRIGRGRYYPGYYNYYYYYSAQYGADDRSVKQTVATPAEANADEGDKDPPG